MSENCRHQWMGEGDCPMCISVKHTKHYRGNGLYIQGQGGESMPKLGKNLSYEEWKALVGKPLWFRIGGIYQNGTINEKDIKKLKSGDVLVFIPFSGWTPSYGVSVDEEVE